MADRHGASLRPSPYSSKLASFDPEGTAALAAVGLVLLDAVHREFLAINDDLPFPLFESVWNLRAATYPLQDCIHGTPDALQASLAAFVAAAEEMRRG